MRNVEIIRTLSRAFVLAAVLTSVGCMYSPTDSQFVDTPWSSVDFHGFINSPGADVALYTMCNNVATPLDQPNAGPPVITSGSSPWTNLFSDGSSWYDWGGQYYIPCWSPGLVSGYTSTVWAESGGTALMSVNPDFLTCWEQHQSSPSDFYQNCASPHSPYAHVSTGDYCNTQSFMHFGDWKDQFGVIATSPKPLVWITHLATDVPNQCNRAWIEVVNINNDTAEKTAPPSNTFNYSKFEMKLIKGGNQYVWLTDCNTGGGWPGCFLDYPNALFLNEGELMAAISQGEVFISFRGTRNTYPAAQQSYENCSGTTEWETDLLSISYSQSLASLVNIDSECLPQPAPTQQQPPPPAVDLFPNVTYFDGYSVQVEVCNNGINLAGPAQVSIGVTSDGNTVAFPMDLPNGIVSGGCLEFPQSIDVAIDVNGSIVAVPAVQVSVADPPGIQDGNILNNIGPTIDYYVNMPPGPLP